MPELPEVSVMRDKLVTWCPAGTTITGAFVLRQNGKYLPGHETKALEGSKVEGIRRRGKMLVFDLDVGKLVCHNAMSGYWDTEESPWTFDYVEGKREATQRDVRVELDTKRWSDRNCTGRIMNTLRFHDSRLFGSLRFYHAKTDDEVPSFRNLGPDALEISPGEFKLRLGGKTLRRQIKDVLMDQAFVAGVGNIYATEALWYSSVRPDRLVSGLSETETESIYRNMRSVLHLGLNKNLDYSILKAYRRESCECGGKMQVVDVKKRSSYFCPTCQV